MIRKNFLGLTVEQNHKTGQINATKFLEQYNAVNVDRALKHDEIQKVTLMRGNHVFKNIDNFKRLEGLDEYLSEVALIEGCNVSDLMVSRRGKNGGTWIRPLVFCKLCRWVSPKFEAHADKILYDHLLELRDKSGDEYKALCAALKAKELATDKFDYMKIAAAISKRVLTTCDNWDTANETELSLRHEIEKYIARAVSDGFIKTLSQALSKISEY